MKISMIQGKNYDSNIFIINGEKPTIIDTGTGLNADIIERQIRKIINPEKIVQILLTHEHFDHVGGVKKIFELTNKKAKVFAHRLSSEKIEEGKSMFAQMLGGQMPKCQIDEKLEDDDKIIIGDEEFKVIHSPGHTPGCICFYSKLSKTLFSGDTIFAHGSFGRYDFPGGDAKQLRNSIEKLSNLDIINLYPGHENIVEGSGNSHMQMTLKNTEYLI